MHLPEEIQREAASIYREALGKGLVKGRSIVELAVACIYVACRVYGIPRPLREVTSASSATKEDIARSYRLILDHIALNIPLPDPKIYIFQDRRKTNISCKTQRVALVILEEMDRSVITAKTQLL